jgi:hypothetical protein
MKRSTTDTDETTVLSQDDWLCRLLFIIKF